MKAKYREEKKLQKQREKSNRKRVGCSYKLDNNVDISSFEIRAFPNAANLMQISPDVKNDSDFKCNDMDSPMS